MPSQVSIERERERERPPMPYEDVENNDGDRGRLPAAAGTPPPRAASSPVRSCKKVAC